VFLLFWRAALGARAPHRIVGLIDEEQEFDSHFWWLGNQSRMQAMVLLTAYIGIKEALVFLVTAFDEDFIIAKGYRSLSSSHSSIKDRSNNLR
jgi:hypothetical protein